MAWPNKYKQPKPERFSTPLFIEKPVTEDELLALYAKHILLECEGNKTLASKIMGISRKAFYYRLSMVPKGDV